jgi:hypothetical protein
MKMTLEIITNQSEGSRAEQNLHFLSQGVHTEVNIKQTGIRPPDFDSAKKFRTATAREQIEGTAVNYAQVINLSLIN